MPPAFCKDKCQLAEDAAVIKSDMSELKDTHNDTQRIVGGMAVEFGKMSQKLESYMERGRDEHTALFKRTSGVVKWTHLSAALVAVSIIIGLVYKLAVGG